MPRTNAPISSRRLGHSLLEVLVAGTLVSVALVPALRLLGGGLAASRQIETREQLITFCTSTLEEHLAGASADWRTGTFTGDFSAEGYSNLRFSVRRSDAAGDGGISDYLMAVTATVWDDQDGSGTFDRGELSVVLAGKVAQLPSYQAEGG
jgi:hypothetical protein